jgi:replicative DNA helicase
MQMPTRVPPHDLGAEEAMIGAMLLSAAAIGDATEICGAGDLYAPAHARIFRAISGLSARGEVADGITVCDELSRQGERQESDRELICLMTRDCPSIDAGRYARIVADHARLRRLIAVGMEVSEQGWTSGDGDGADMAIERAEAWVLAQRPTLEATLVGAPDLAFAGLEAALGGGDLAGVPSGLPDLDRITGGAQAGRLYVVGARPGMGKSAMLAGMAVAAAAQGVPVLLASLEMGHTEVGARLLAGLCRVPAPGPGQAPLSGSHLAKWESAAERLSSMPITVDDDCGLSVGRLASRGRRLQSRAGLGLILVDYLQLMSGTPGRKEHRQLEVAEIARGLKLLARELGVPIVAAAQLSRAVETRADKRPMLSDLRDSGEIEQAADVVIGLYRDEVYSPDSPDRGTAEVSILKNRQGRQGMIRAVWEAPTTSFLALSFSRPDPARAAGSFSDDEPF